MTSHRVVVIGGGHNALVAAAYLGRAGLDVEVLERLPHVGGAAVSAQVFDGFDARLSRYSYLVSLLPEELIGDLDLSLQLRSRRTASFTPYTTAEGADGLLVETDEGPATRDSFRRLTGGEGEFIEWQRFYAEVGTLARAVAPTLLEPLPRESSLRGSVDPVVWTDLVERPIGEAIERRFAHDLVRGVVATDALIGTFASVHDPSRVQNRCFLYHVMGNGTGEWRVPVGGMGAVTAQLEQAARAAGVRIRTGVEVVGVRAHDDRVEVTTSTGETLAAAWALSGVAPHVLERLRGRRLGDKPSGSQLKVNLLVSRLPRLKSGIDPAVAFAGTFHIGERLSELEAAYSEASDGALPARAAGEIYCHTLTDRSILGPDLAASQAQTLTYFGLHTPAAVLPDEAAGRLALEQFVAAFEEHLAEPLEPLVLGIEYKTPRQIEDALGMPGGHIFHGDLQWPWLSDDEPAGSPLERWGVATDHPRLVMCGSGARRGGAVSGIGGHNAAHAVLDLIASLSTP
ncbi:MAG TPA: NAD(P)/FAD-dependent oxidoreductase [Aeromicrobium sp.]|nr:NAD(P)/FAD-dependent oxidoreductase [Aeromicrobium sp.]